MSDCIPPFLNSDKHKIMDCKKIIHQFYAPGTPLERALWLHSSAVAMKALECIQRRNIDADALFVAEAALLHDIGIYLCHAPSIHCPGAEPYIRHGLLGAQILESLGLPRHAAVCARHTGAGLSRADIAAQNLPLPDEDFLPVTTEEKLICYADKFFSKSDDSLLREKPFEKVVAQMKAHGEDTLKRFLALHDVFGY